MCHGRVLITAHVVGGEIGCIGDRINGEVKRVVDRALADAVTRGGADGEIHIAGEVLRCGDGGAGQRIGLTGLAGEVREGEAGVACSCDEGGAVGQRNGGADGDVFEGDAKGL
jgi:hypothetical protein